MPQLILIVIVGFALILLLGKLFAVIAERREERRPDAYNRAIRRLWDEYQRERAVPLIRALVEGHGESLIAQYWLNQLRTVEPELAHDSLGDEFLSRHVKPEVAAACGPVG
jgi:type II secretory pathway pseudopilin PulG